MQAVCDTICNFVCVNIEEYGKESDRGIFMASAVYQHLETGTSKLTKEVNLPLTDSYPLKYCLMKPHENKSKPIGPQEHYKYNAHSA
jgi:hypothetical protein